MIRSIYITLIVCTALIGTDTTEYQIKFYNIPVAKATITHSDTIFNGTQSKLITFSAISNMVTNFIFPIDNHYRIVVDDDTYNILDFQKHTYQPNIINTLSTIKMNNRVFYTGTKIEIQGGVFNIFTLLDYISYNDYSNLLINNFLLEREGILYDAALTKEMDYLLLDINQISNNRGIIEFTDIFTWAVFKDDGKRMIWIDKDNNCISRCVFEINGMQLEAVQIDKQ